nr:PAS domain S-box protein [Actinomycetota bacterium]
MPITYVAMDGENNERKHAEEGPRRRGIDGETLLEAIPDLVFRIDRGGEFLDFRVNDDDDLYVPREAIVGRTLRDAMPPEVADEALRCVARTLKTGEAQAFEYRLPMPRGALDYEARMVASGADEVLCLVRDVTERKEAERRLEEGEARFRQLFENPADALFVIHPETREVVDCNREACRS